MKYIERKMDEFNRIISTKDHERFLLFYEN